MTTWELMHHPVSAAGPIVLGMSAAAPIIAAVVNASLKANSDSNRLSIVIFCRTTGPHEKNFLPSHATGCTESC
jgi:hypothetical protein